MKIAIVLFVLFFTVSSIFFISETTIGEYFNIVHPSIIRIRTQLPTVFRYASIYSVFILVLLVTYVFLDRKCNSFICKLVSKLDASDQLIWLNNKSFTGIDRKSLFYLSLFSLSVVATRNWSSILYGYFKYDDFEFFSANRTESLITLLITPHGDHLLPLYRLEVALMNFLFGVNPLYYNLFVSLLFALLLIFAGLLLREMKTSQSTNVLFAILCIGWIDWGEITAGYFCISIYVQITLLSMISIWSYFRWARTSAAIYKVLTIVCIGIAIFLDISGIWVPLGVLMFSISDFLSERSGMFVRDWLKSHKWLLTAIVTTCSSFALLNLFVFFISKHGVFLSMSGNYKHTLLSFLSQMFYLISGGLLLTPLFPIGINILPPAILIPLLAILFVFAGYIIFKTFENSEREVRWHIFSVLSIILMTAAIVVIGRPMSGFKYALVAKYTGVLYLWFCLLICLVWNHYWQKNELPGKNRMATATIVLLVFYIGQQMFFDKILFLYQAESTGYKVNIAEAKIRKNNVNEIRQRLMLPLLASQRSELRVPTLDGNYIFNAYPKLFKYNLSHYVDFVVPKGERVVLYKNKAMQTWATKDVVEVASLRSNTDKEFIQILENDSYVQQLYLSSVELTANTISETAVKTDLIKPGQLVKATALSQRPNGDVLLHSNGSAELIIDKGDWNPEERHVLVLKVEPQGTTMTDNVKLEVHFTGELKIPYNKSYIPIASRKKNIITIDLLQIYSYSLNPRVGSLRIGFPVPGKYLVSGANLI